MQIAMRHAREVATEPLAAVLHPCEVAAEPVVAVPRASEVAVEPLIAVLHVTEVAAEPALLSATERVALVAIRGARRRDEWIRGRLAIRRVLGDPAASVVVAPDGAPEVIGRACHVSLSHDGDWIAVAIHDALVGIDLCVRAHGARVARILAWLGVRGDVDALAGFAALEAVLKLRRLPIEALRDRPLALATRDRAIVVSGLGDPVTVRLHHAPEYVVGLAA